MFFGKKIAFILPFFLGFFSLFLYQRWQLVSRWLFSFKINLERAKDKDNLVPLAVLGSGPASLSAALYGSRAKVKTIVIKGNQAGGQLIGTSFVENWPAIRRIRGTQVIKDLEEQAQRFGAVMVSDAVSRVDFNQWPYRLDLEEGKTLYALSVVIGTGSTPRLLQVKGEQQYWGRGVTTCAICDAPYHKGNDVVVVGGGDSAVEEALELSPYAKNVKLLVRSDTMRASPTMIEHLKRCVNVTILFNSSITSINGNDDAVTDVTAINNKTKKTFTIPAKGVFLAIGHTPNAQLFMPYLATDKQGYISLFDQSQITSRPGIFVAGDVCDKRYKQAGVAAGNGIKAALDAVWWLSSLGYNQEVEEGLEKKIFDAYADKKIEIEQVNSVKYLDDMIKNIQEEILVLDFFRLDCPSCMQLIPTIESVATRLQGKVRFIKIDASMSFDIVKRYRVPSVPYMLVLKRGKRVAFSQDIMTRSQLYDFVIQYQD